jgi:branched-subunit amino acid transport protein
VNLWLTIVAMGIVTYAIRLSLLVFVNHALLPQAARDALRYVMPAVLLAIILPAVLYVGEDESLSISLGNERLLAAAFAAAVAWLTRNVWLTVATGMPALWLLQWAVWA